MVMLPSHSSLSSHAQAWSDLAGSGGGAIMPTERPARLKSKGRCYNPASRWQQLLRSRPGLMRQWFSFHLTSLRSPHSMQQQIKHQMVVTIFNGNSTFSPTVRSPDPSSLAPAVMHWPLCLFTMYTRSLDQRGWQGEGSSTYDGGSPLRWVAHKRQHEEVPAHRTLQCGLGGRACTEIIIEVTQHFLRKHFLNPQIKFRSLFTHSHHCHCFVAITYLSVDYSVKVSRVRTTPAVFTTVPSAVSTVTGMYFTLINCSMYEQETDIIMDPMISEQQTKLYRSFNEH